MSLTRQNIELWGGNIPLLAGLREKGLSAFERAGLPTAKSAKTQQKSKKSLSQQKLYRTKFATFAGCKKKRL